MIDVRKTALIFGISGKGGFTRNGLAMELKLAGFDVLSAGHVNTTPT